MATRHGPRAPKTDAPEHVRAAKLELRRLGAAEREVRKRWYAAREGVADTAAAQGLHPTDYTASDLEAGRIGVLTLSLWAAENARLAAAARWRIILSEREAMPVDQRWNLRDLEAWAAWSAGVV